MNLLDLYRDDVSGDGKIISVSGGREYRGPCPSCEGTDRFGVWPEQNGGRGSFFCGRGAAGGNGCGIGGDAIQYLRDARNYSYQEACDLLGIEVKRGGESLQYRSPVVPKKYQDPVFTPLALDYPEDVVNPELWNEHGMKFIEACHKALLARPMSIAYLMARGITMVSIVKYKLGFHAGSKRGSRDYEPSFRPWPSWGLKDIKKENGKHRMIILPAGLVIPFIHLGRLHRITVRLIKQDPRQPKKKYHYVRGSIRDLWLSNPKARAFVIQEAELDCIAVDEAVGDLVGTLGLGSTGTKPDVKASKVLARSLAILGALDFDKPKLNKRTGKMERPGASGGLWWQQQYPQYRRWPVPVGKDAGEAFAKGLDLRAWIMAGLPPVVTGETALAQVKKENKKDQRPAPIPVADIRELKEILEDANGFFRIYDHGNAVGPELSPDWSHANPEKRRRLSSLLFNSEAVGRLVANLSDGLYGAVHIKV